MKNKLLGALGLLRKAGALVMGFEAVGEAAAKGKLHLIILAEDLSPKSARQMHIVGEKHNIEVVTAPIPIEEIGYLLGKRAGILGAANEGLADKVRMEISRVSEED